MPIDPPFASISVIASSYRSGAISPEEVCHQAQERLKLLDPSLNAFIDPMTEAVMEQARQASQELRQGKDRGPLHGVPVAVKDIIDVEGIATSYATKAVAPKLAERDADCIRKLREAGAIVFGKTNLLEFAAGIAHPDFGQTNNPLDPTRTAGGSSGGSAAAVAAGIVPLALGTDTGGSVRAPASYCGLTGFKPSFGLLSLEGVCPLSPSLDHLGFLCRNSSDAVLAFAALRGSEPPLQKTEVGGLRLGIVANQWWHDAICPDVADVLSDVKARLEHAGISLQQVELPSPEAMAEILLDILMPEAALIHREILNENPSGYAPGTRELMEAGQNLPATRYIEAKKWQKRWCDDLESCMSNIDALISPTVPFTAPDTDPALSSEGDDEIISLTHANLTGAPSISIRCGLAKKLPVGLQITGRVGADDQLLGIAQVLESLLPAS